MRVTVGRAVGTRDKREAAIRRNRRQVRFEDLAAVLRGAGFEQRGGAHAIFVHAASGARCNVPQAHGRGETYLLACYVDAAIEALDRQRVWAAEQERKRRESEP